MIYITEKIGEEYKEWKAGDIVFISSPTGSGKTTFILEQLLPYVINQNKRMLYLVNRHVLKEQLEKDLRILPINKREYINIELYQKLENTMTTIKYRNDKVNVDNGVEIRRYAIGEKALFDFAQYDYVICDECHYFLADSNYNANTQLSFDWIGNAYSTKIQIFLSATIDDIKEYIKEDKEKRKYQCTSKYRFQSCLGNGAMLAIPRKIWEYNNEPDYDYIDVKLFEDRKDVINILLDEDTKNSKWLIFVDSIHFGNEVKQELIKKLKQKEKKNSNIEKKVIMISSDYTKDKEISKERDYIQKNERFEAKYLIATSVIDNGVNLKDISLRNLVIFADTKVEFIQMLGRKRQDGNKISLYIWKHNKVHFENRLRTITRRKEIAEKLYLELSNQVARPLKEGLSLEYGEVRERSIILEQSIKLIQDMADNKVAYEDVRSFCYPYNGVYRLNLLSLMQIDILNKCYDEIKSRFECEGEYAFAKEQLRWLKKTETEIDTIIFDSNISREEKSRSKIIAEIEKLHGERLIKKDAIEFKKSIVKELVLLTKSVDISDKDKKKLIEDLKKGDRPLSEPNMEFFYKYCNIPYSVEVEDSTYQIVPRENK